MIVGQPGTVESYFLMRLQVGGMGGAKMPPLLLAPHPLLSATDKGTRELTFAFPATALRKVYPAPRLGSTVELTLLVEAKVC